jgi:outer membrane protein assembly factor BamB
MCPSLVTHEGIVYCVGGKTGGSLAVKAGGSGDVTDTHRLWTGKNGSNVTSPVLHEGHLYWAHENLGIAYCAEAATGKILYEERLPRGDQVYASAVLIDGKAYYTTRGGKTFVVAAKPQFELLATNVLTNGGVFNASAAVHDGRLYIRADKYLVCIGK